MSISTVGYGPIRRWTARAAVVLVITASVVPVSGADACERSATPVRMVCALEAIEPTDGNEREQMIDWWTDPPPAWLQATGTATGRL